MPDPRQRQRLHQGRLTVAPSEVAGEHVLYEGKVARYRVDAVGNVVYFDTGRPAWRIDGRRVLDLEGREIGPPIRDERTDAQAMYGPRPEKARSKPLPDALLAPTPERSIAATLYSAEGE